jgi:hypothetical protein
MVGQAGQPHLTHSLPAIFAYLKVTGEIQAALQLHNPPPGDIILTQRWAAKRRPPLVVLDGLAESPTADDLVEDKVNDVLKFFRSRLRPFADDSGAAVPVLRPWPARRVRRERFRLPSPKTETAGSVGWRQPDRTVKIQALQISAQNIVCPSFSQRAAAIRRNLREARPKPFVGMSRKQ